MKTEINKFKWYFPLEKIKNKWKETWGSWRGRAGAWFLFGRMDILCRAALWFKEAAMTSNPSSVLSSRPPTTSFGLWKIDPITDWHLTKTPPTVVRKSFELYPPSFQIDNNTAITVKMRQFREALQAQWILANISGQWTRYSTRIGSLY